MKIGIRAHDFGCLPPVRLAEKMAAQGVEAAQLAIPKAIAGVESYAQVTDGRCARSARLSGNTTLISPCWGAISSRRCPMRLRARRSWIRSAWGCAVRRSWGRAASAPRRRFFPGPEQERPAAYDILRRSVDAMLNDAAEAGCDRCGGAGCGPYAQQPALAAGCFRSSAAGALRLFSTR